MPGSQGGQVGSLDRPRSVGLHFGVQACEGLRVLAFARARSM